MSDIYQDGTLGILLADSDALAWAQALVFASILGNNLTSYGLPVEQENLLIVILLPV